MTESFFQQCVQKHFDWLIEDDNFRVVARHKFGCFDNEEVVVESPRCRISVGLERSDVYVGVAPLSSVEEIWFYLGGVIKYLTQGADHSCDFDIPRSVEYETRIEQKVARFAEILHKYRSRVYEVVSPETFHSRRADLMKWV